MKKLRCCLVIALLLLAVQCTVFAQAPSAVKYSQLPNTDWSYSFSSEIKAPVGAAPFYISQMADDWKCNATGDVTDIHWWGSYWLPPTVPYYTDYSDGLPSALSGGITAFNISFWTDIPVGPGIPYSRPGQAFRSFTVQGTASETEDFEISLGDLTRKVYKYDYYLTAEQQFEQVKDTIYWVSIQAVLPDETKQWGWHETMGYKYDMSVIQKNNSGYWYFPCGGHDMAFELTTVPEPSGILAMLSGLGGIVGFGFRRRK